MTPAMNFLLRFFTWWNGQTFGTQVWTSLYGEVVGDDEFGNRYYRTRGGKIDPGLGFERRWVIYNGVAEASTVPPSWHGWLHHTVDVPPTKDKVVFSTRTNDPIYKERIDYTRVFGAGLREGSSQFVHADHAVAADVQSAHEGDVTALAHSGCTRFRMRTTMARSSHRKPHGAYALDSWTLIRVVADFGHE